MLKPAHVILNTMNLLAKRNEGHAFTKGELYDMTVESGLGWAGRAVRYLAAHGYVVRNRSNLFVLTRKGSETS